MPAFVSFVLLGMIFAWRNWPAGSNSGQNVSIQTLATYGQKLFFTIVTIELSLVLLAAPAATAGAVCLDKARGTLDHMLATDLSNAEIVLGKLGVRLIPVLGLVACLLPLSALDQPAGRHRSAGPVRLISHVGRLRRSGLLAGHGPFGLGSKDARSVDGHLSPDHYLAQQPAPGRCSSRSPLGAARPSSVPQYLRDWVGVCQSVRSRLSAVYLTGKGRRVDLCGVRGVLFLCVRVAGSSGGLPNSSRRDQAGWAGIDPAARTIRSRFLAAGLAAAAAGSVARRQPGPLARVAAVQALAISARGVVPVYGAGTDLGGDCAAIHGPHPHAERAGHRHGDVSGRGRIASALSVSAATSLAEERVRGSLDILLSTPLSTFSILVGQMVGGIPAGSARDSLACDSGRHPALGSAGAGSGTSYSSG